MEMQVRIPVADGLELAATLLWGDGVPLAEVGAVIILSQMHPETQAAVLPRARRMAAAYGQSHRWATLTLDYRGHGGSGGTPDPTAVQADRDAVVAWLRPQLKPDAGIHFWGWPEPRQAELHWLPMPLGADMPVFVYRPGAASRGTIFFASSSPDWTELHEQLALMLTAAGYAVVGVTSLEVPERIWAATGQLVTVEQFLAAYEALWPFAQTVTADSRPLTLLGHSAGSSGNLLLAAHVGAGRPGLQGRIRGVVGYGNSANKGFAWGFEQVVDDAIWQLEPYLPQVQVPVYMVQGDVDFIPPAEVEPQVRLLGGPVHWQVIAGADHNFTDLFAELAGLVRDGLRFVGA